MHTPIHLTVRHRRMLHHLLHRELGRCTVATLGLFDRLGWVVGPDYQLTMLGRRVAEASEEMPPLDRPLELSLAQLWEEGAAVVGGNLAFRGG